MKLYCQIMIKMASSSLKYHKCKMVSSQVVEETKYLKSSKSWLTAVLAEVKENQAFKYKLTIK